MRMFWKNQKGVTMIEVLVTVGLLAIIIVPCLSSFVVAQRGNALAEQTYNEYTQASNLMEELKAKGELIGAEDLQTLCQEKYPDIIATIVDTQMDNYQIILVKNKDSGEEILKGVITP